MDIKLRTFPSRDREFGAFVRTAWENRPATPTPEALQRDLRVRYPASIVVIQSDLARHGEGPDIWYVFRTGNLGVAPIDDEPPATWAILDDEPPDAWAILDDERRFVEVSRGLAAIAELPAHLMVGQHVEDFSNPDDPTIRDDIARLWKQFLTHRSIASTLRFNYEDGRPRELAYRLVADAAGHGRHRLTVRVLSEGDATGDSAFDASDPAG
jgi:PAS domain-containing protein